jgi:hypothetical protein
MQHMGVLKTREQQRTTLFLDPALHKWLRLRAIEKGTTMTDLVNAVLERYRKTAEPKIRRSR